LWRATGLSAEVLARKGDFHRTRGSDFLD
jgi:hypothetical protein